MKNVDNPCDNFDDFNLGYNFYYRECSYLGYTDDLANLCLTKESWEVLFH